MGDHLRIDCAHNSSCLIKLSSAYYGYSPRNRDVTDCSFSAGHCLTNASDVWSACDGRRSCDVFVRQARGRVRSKCSDASHYMTLTYSCECTGLFMFLPALHVQS